MYLYNFAFKKCLSLHTISGLGYFLTNGTKNIPLSKTETNEHLKDLYFFSFEYLSMLINKTQVLIDGIDY